MLYLDVETIPQDTALLAPYPRDERSPPSNYKNPEAIDGWYAKDEQAWRAGLVKACSLSPLRGRLLSVAHTTETTRERVTQTYALTEASERALLQDAWSAIDDQNFRVCTWNGAGLDLRFLAVRALVHELPVPTLAKSNVREWFKRYGSANHVDLKAILCNGDLTSSDTLDVWAAFFGLPQKPDGMSGAEVYPAFLRGEHARIQEYNSHDARTLALLHERVGALFG